jgi:hypothetical protein
MAEGREVADCVLAGVALPVGGLLRRLASIVHVGHPVVDKLAAVVVGIGVRCNAGGARVERVEEAALTSATDNSGTHLARLLALLRRLGMAVRRQLVHSGRAAAAGPKVGGLAGVEARRGGGRDHRRSHKSEENLGSNHGKLGLQIPSCTACLLYGHLVLGSARYSWCASRKPCWWLSRLPACAKANALSSLNLVAAPCQEQPAVAIAGRCGLLNLDPH